MRIVSEHKEEKVRKNQKAQIDGLFDLLADAHKTVESCINKRKYDEAALVLEDCQDAAIGIGKAIDGSEGEDTETVKALEEYCEIIYLIHEDLLSGSSLVASDIANRLRKILKTILHCYRKEVKVKREVVFLPYKASMWDSLESVWKKYDADPEWDARVIPIPYYDKNPDGTFSEFHYEGNDYPEYVPITFYKNYDLEENHPDEIYIHNPYDDANYVTSIEPHFYSKNIKNYTDKLIYIPYFVLSEPNPNDKNVIESISHFVQTPGVIHAHEVIVQSENMRKCYIEAMVMLAGEHTRSIWQRKIKGTGSPKFDKVVNVTKEDIELPVDWKQKICRKDNTEKKVILYNTSVTSLLQESEDMIEKIMDVLSYFKTKTDDVILLWRPHPLIKATISSMRPMLWDAYEKIVEWYKSENFGIYDDTADLDRAITISDAYYGDGSSLVQLCQKVKMPVMIQNVHVRCCDEG